MEALEIIKQRADLIKNSSEEINKTQNLEQLYLLIDKMNESVKLFYHHIGCKDRCFLCCQHANIPSATALEWSYLFNSIKNSNTSFTDEIIDKTEKLFSTHGKYLKNIHFALNNDDEPEKIKELYDNLPKFKGKSCIFLKDGSCSIYLSRPAKCRTQGFSLMQQSNNILFQTCLPETVKMEDLLSKQGNRSVLMPLLNDYEKHIQELNSYNNISALTEETDLINSTDKPNGKIVTSILPVWLYSHIQDKQLIPQVNFNPDFHKVLENF